MTGLYIYGTQLYGSRYTLLYSENILDTLKDANSRSRAPAFVAAEPGLQTPPNFERSAAALQRHLGGSSIGVRGSQGLTITPVLLEIRDDCSVKHLNSQQLCRIQRWRLLQSWRGGEFGCYDVPAEAVKTMFSLKLLSDTDDPKT